MARETSALELGTKMRIPDHVVFRTFVHETVVLNLKTGRYHGLNTTAGEMLVAIQTAGSIGGALDELEARYSGVGARLADDLLRFCEHAMQRGLIDVEAG